MQAKRFEALDGWRGIAALFVAIYHMPIAHGLRASPSWANLQVFVDFFFVLSGFVIMHAWGARLDGFGAAQRFMRKRFWRVWPLHITVLMVWFGVEVLKAIASSSVQLNLESAPFTEDRVWQALLTNILMIQSFNLHGMTTWNGPAWSISVEFWTYLVFAALLICFPRRINRALLIAAIGGFAGLAFFSPIYLFATHDFGMFRALYGFSVGALAYSLSRSRDGEEGGGNLLEIAAVVALSIYVLRTGENATSLIAPLVFGAVVLIFSRETGVISRGLKSTPVQKLGLWSYSIYLVHVLLNYVMSVFLLAAARIFHFPVSVTREGTHRVFSLGNGYLDAGLFIAMIALTIAISALTYRFIEKPFMSETAGPRPLPAPEGGYAEPAGTKF